MQTLWPAHAPVNITDDDGIRELSAYLNRFERPRLLVVITAARNNGKPSMDPQALYDAYASRDSDRIDVAVIRSNRLTGALTERIGPE